VRIVAVRLGFEGGRLGRLTAIGGFEPHTPRARDRELKAGYPHGTGRALQIRAVARLDVSLAAMA